MKENQGLFPKPGYGILGRMPGVFCSTALYQSENYCYIGVPIVAIVAQCLTNPTKNHAFWGSVPALAQFFKHLSLL